MPVSQINLKYVKIGKAIKPTKPIKQTKPIKPTKPTKPIKPIKSIKPIKPTKPTTQQVILINQPKKYALLVGCNYKSTSSELFGCINDVLNLEAKLNELKYNSIIKLTDETQNKSTRDNIINELIKILNNAKSTDTVFFSFSGHGTQTADLNGEEKDGNDEIIVPLDFKYIKDDELSSLIVKNLKSGVKFFALFDCCHSGSMLDLDSIKTDKDITMISGCLDSQTSADAFIDKKSQGAMTWSFLQTLKVNKNIGLNDLVENMNTLLKNDNYSQRPQLATSSKVVNRQNFI